MEPKVAAFMGENETVLAFFAGVILASQAFMDKDPLGLHIGEAPHICG